MMLAKQQQTSQQSPSTTETAKGTDTAEPEIAKEAEKQTQETAYTQETVTHDVDFVESSHNNDVPRSHEAEEDLAPLVSILVFVFVYFDIHNKIYWVFFQTQNDDADLNDTAPDHIKQGLFEEDEPPEKRAKTELSADEVEASFTAAPTEGNEHPTVADAAQEQVLSTEVGNQPDFIPCSCFKNFWVQEQDLADDMLLAFSFFDPKGHYYIAKPDLCLLIHSLGKNWSQRNILALVEPVVVKERLNYKNALPQVVKHMIHAKEEWLSD